MTSQLTLGALTIYGDFMPEGNFQAESRFFSDWYSLSESKSDERERPLAEGAFGIDRDWRSSLPLMLTGWYRGAHWPSKLAALRVAAAKGGSVLVTVTDDVGTSWRRVSVRQMIPDPNPLANSFDFEVHLLATHPRLYAPQQTAVTDPPSAGTGQPWPQQWPAQWGSGGNPGRAAATNPGPQATPLRLTVSGGLASGVELVELVSGRVLRLERVIPDGSQVVFDAGIGRAYLDQPANDITGFMTRREWNGFQVPSEGAANVQFTPLGATTGTPKLTVQWAPTL